jgi:hypothetical protein
MAYDDTLIVPYVGMPNSDEYYNQLARNIDYLKTGQVVQFTATGTPASYQTGSTPNFVEIDSSFTLDITTHGLPVTAGFTGNFQRLTNGNAALDIKHQYVIGGIAYPDPLDPDDSNTAGLAPFVALAWTPISIMKNYLFLPAGVHRFKFVWRISNAGTDVFLDGVTKPQSWVYEGM